MSQQFGLGQLGNSSLVLSMVTPVVLSSGGLTGVGWSKMVSPTYLMVDAG